MTTTPEEPLSDDDMSTTHRAGDAAVSVVAATRTAPMAATPTAPMAATPTAPTETPRTPPTATHPDRTRPSQR